MRYSNQMHDRYNPGTDLTCHTTTSVAGKTFAAIAGPMVNNLISITTATEGGRVVGVVKYDQAAEQAVGVARGATRIVTVTAEGPIPAGAPVIVGTAGKAKAAPEDAALVVGYAVDTAIDGADALINLAG